MEKIAYINDGTFLYWSSIILTLAAVTAIGAFVAMYLKRGGRAMAVCLTVPLCIGASLVLSRLVHWYCRTDSYSGFGAAMTDYSGGGHALLGVFAACILVTCVLRLCKVTKNLPKMLDCMALAGGMGIAVGRLSSLFNATDRGFVVSDGVSLPFAFQVANGVTGQVENRLATFLFQAVAAAVIVAALLIWQTGCRKKQKPIRDGDVCLLFLAAYGASQVVLDSTRYDSLFLRSNGFVSVVQLLGAAAVVLALVIFSIRLVKNRGMKAWYVGIWTVAVIMLALAGYMEYYVQRHGDQVLIPYTVMTVALAVLLAAVLTVRNMAGSDGLTFAEYELEEEEIPEEPVEEPAAEAAAEKPVWEKKVRQPRERKPLKLPEIKLPAFAGISGKQKGIAAAVCTLVLLVVGVWFLSSAFLGGFWTRTSVQSTSDSALMDRFDMYMTNEISNALEGVLSVEKVYWLSDDDLVAPEPDPEKFGVADDATSLQWLLDEAAELLDGQETVFNTETPVWDKSDVMYYLDETIFAVTWKQRQGGCIYTYSEVKIADGSQFRRFLAGGEYGSDKQFTTTEMAASVNAVVASSGDFYKYRRQGVIVYDGVVQRVDGYYVDTCFIDDKGDLIFAYRGDITDMETAQQFVDDNNIRFSVAFGPILIDDGVTVTPWNYALGEIEDHFPRAALCQMDDLHYVVVVCNMEGGYNDTPTIWGFASQIEKLGCKKAYTLDGGQTGVIAMNDQLINAVHFGTQRQISDIFYFATALPGGG